MLWPLFNSAQTQAAMFKSIARWWAARRAPSPMEEALMTPADNADTGAMGGKAPTEFMVKTDAGEDLIAFNVESRYAANVEKATSVIPAERAPNGEDQGVAPPGSTSASGNISAARRPIRSRTE